MKNHILAKVELIEGGWVGEAYESGGVLAIGAAQSEEEVVAQLRAQILDYLAVDGQYWLGQMAHGGSPDTPNCPEGAIKLPVDIWVCKVAKQTCPIQAQVFLKNPDAFFRGCLLDQIRKEGIFNAVARGDYQGFHHVRGRYLCPACEDEHDGQRTTNYHYPWELARLSDFSRFDIDRDAPAAIRAGVSRSAILHPLCAKHAVEITTILFPEAASTLKVLEVEVFRPGRSGGAAELIRR